MRTGAPQSGYKHRRQGSTAVTPDAIVARRRPLADRPGLTSKLVMFHGSIPTKRLRIKIVETGGPRLIPGVTRVMVVLSAV
jgi:hypothetical protein